MRPDQQHDATVLATLRDEFEAAEGSFLLALRCELTWNEGAFDRLTQAMSDYVRAREPEGDIPRWIAEGFWYVDWFVKDWSTHPSFPRVHGQPYYEAAYERLKQLACELFHGEDMIDGPREGLA